MAPPTHPAERPTLNEVLLRYEADDPDNELVSRDMAEIEQMESDARGFRSAAPDTQMQQDRYLALYRRFTMARFQLPSTATDDEVDEYGFPEDHNKLLQHLRYYIIFVFQHGQPPAQSGQVGDHIDYATLTQHRDAMLFWVKHLYARRAIDPPRANTIYDSMTQVMRYCQHTFR